MKRPWFSVLVFLIIIIICVVIFSPTDKKRIWKVIVASEKAIIDEDIDGLMEGISFNYRDEYGGTYLLIKRRMETVFKRLDNIDTEIQLVKISVDKKQAEADINVRVTASHGEGRSYIAGDPANWQNMKIYLEKLRYKWEVISVKGLFDYDL